MKTSTAQHLKRLALHALSTAPLVLSFGWAQAQVVQPAPQLLQSGVQLDASRTITTGCTFGTVQHGTLGVSSDYLTLGSSINGGTRPNLVVNVIGSATLAQSTNPVWTRDGQSLAGVTSTSVLMSQATGGGTIVLPLNITIGGSYTYHLDVSGTRTNGFMTAGVYKVSTTFTCI